MTWPTFLGRTLHPFGNCLFSLGPSGSCPGKGKCYVVTRCSIVILPTPPGIAFVIIKCLGVLCLFERAAGETAGSKPSL